MKNTQKTEGKTSTMADGVTETAQDYWQGQWKEGTTVAVSDGDFTIGTGNIISLHEDPDWASVQLENGEIVNACKFYCYRLLEQEQ